MPGPNCKEVLDRIILAKLSLYDSLDVLQLCYELGEDGALRNRMTGKQIFSRLESLRDKGLIEQKKLPNGDIRWALKKRGVGDNLKVV